MAEDGRVIGQRVLPEKSRTAQALVPAIRSQFDAAGWKPTDVQLIAVTQGPGSFTGLRVGITTAKTFAYAVSAQVIGVNTLLALAEQAPR